MNSIKDNTDNSVQSKKEDKEETEIVVETMETEQESISTFPNVLMPELEALVKKNPNQLIGCGA